MSQQPQFPPAPSAAVVEWGDGGPGDGPSALSRMTTGFPGLRWLVPSIAALGGAALFASLINDWQLIRNLEGTIEGNVEFDGPPDAQRYGIDDLFGWSPGYLAGVLLLVTATVVLLFGPPGGRQYARFAALGAGGGLFAMLVAIAMDLTDAGLFSGMSPEEVQITYGSGLWCAFIGVTAVTVAVYLTGRLLPAGSPAAPPPGAAPGAVLPYAPAPGAVFPQAQAPGTVTPGTAAWGNPSPAPASPVVAATGPDGGPGNPSTGSAAADSAASPSTGSPATGSPPTGSPATDSPPTGSPPTGDPSTDWPWQRPPAPTPQDPAPDAPLDLTVGRAEPFTTPNDIYRRPQ